MGPLLVSLSMLGTLALVLLVDGPSRVSWDRPRPPNGEPVGLWGRK